MSLHSWFEIQSIADDILAKFVPAHVNIFYCFEGIVLTTFILQAASGFGLTLYYRPTVAEAFSSVHFIVSEVNIGWLLRLNPQAAIKPYGAKHSSPHFKSLLNRRVQKPRKLTWISRVLLAILTVSFGVTGYSLPWDGKVTGPQKLVTSYLSFKRFTKWARYTSYYSEEAFL